MLAFLLTITDEEYRPLIRKLYRRYHNEIYAYAYVALKKKGVQNIDGICEDAVQNTFLKLTKYVGSIDMNRSENEIRAYLFTMVTNEVENIVSAEEKFDQLSESLEDPSGMDFISEIHIRERYEEVVRAVRNMEPIYSTVLRLRFFEERSVKEIARLLGISEDAVYKRIQRARKILKEKVGGGTDGNNR